MTSNKQMRLSRRKLLEAFSVLGATGAANLPGIGRGRGAALAAEEKKPKFLIVLAATGGASIIDSFLAVRASECSSAATLNTFPDALVNQVGPFRAVKHQAATIGEIPFPVATDQTAFVTKHQQEMLVATCIGTSVNHAIAQKRALTGNAAWKGRTLQECVALEYGAAFPLPNVNMGFGGYLERGSDDALPARCYAEAVSQALVWPLGLDGARGIAGAPDRELLALARRLRDEKLDPQSIFARTFAGSTRLKRWTEQRIQGQQTIEACDLISKLNILPDGPAFPLTSFGLGSSAQGPALRAKFPNYLIDPLEAQAALAFLLLKHRVSCAVTLSPSFNVVVETSKSLANLPLAFDFSHQDHRSGQAFMWSKTLALADRLIDLLKAEPFDAAGESLWDRTLIYVATDFGRTRSRPANATAFSTGHDMNNGFLLLSPLTKGGTVLGGVDASTTLVHGFDPETGAPEPDKRLSNESDVFAGLVHALSIDTAGSGLPDAKAFRKE
jgi:hypothetical protein